MCRRGRTSPEAVKTATPEADRMRFMVSRLRVRLSVSVGSKLGNTGILGNQPRSTPALRNLYAMSRPPSGRDWLSGYPSFCGWYHIGPTAHKPATGIDFPPFFPVARPLRFNPALLSQQAHPHPRL